ncbi:response regulator [Desulfobotulus sp. H1]|uniref:histidine kinase n=1 Tax=Desulfobotulus pelophilus TaxID=2823377 RepID=A0ABT3N5D4_9BACT|nr:response regulator [Desulfobotulus pelophilus]MCW7752668.1 response regulator [Desulfobotulus pelophilus]
MPLPGFSRRSLSRDLISGLSLSLCLLFSILGTIYYIYLTHQSNKALQEQAQAISQEIAHVLSGPAWQLDNDLTTRIATAYLHTEHMAGLRVIFSPNTVVFAHMPDPNNPHTFRKTRTMEQIRDDGTLLSIGSVEVWFSREGIRDMQSTLIRMVCIIVLLSTALVILVIQLLMASLLQGPLDSLLRNIKAIAAGNFDSAIPPVPQEDINAIISEINTMATRIAAHTDQLKAEIRERKQAETALLISEKKYRSIFENALEGIFQITFSGRIININPSMARIFGYRHIDEMMHLVDNFENELFVDPEIPVAIRQQLESGRTIQNFETRLRRKDGRKIWGAIQARVEKNPETGLPFVEGMLEDISERKEAEAALKSANRLLESRVLERTAALQQANEKLKAAKEKAEKNAEVLNLFARELEVKNEELARAKDLADAATEAKSRFLANMSHEIRTPMNAIMGMTYLTLKTALSPKQKDYLEKIQTATDSLLRIINDILDFSKIEAGHMEMEAVAFRMDEILTRLANQTALKAHEKNLELIFITNPEIPSQCVGDPLRLGQILINLVSNAVKFTEKGQITLSVHPGEKTPEGIQLFFSVQDTGIGMTEQQQAELFRPFNQVDASMTRRYEGSGLGLSISKRLVEMMGGQISVTSEAGKGSTFSFDVWLAPCHSQPGRETSLAPVLRDLRVMIVEDNAASRQVLSEYTETLSMRPRSFADGEKALQHLQTEKTCYDLFFLDWKLPGMSGIDLARWIRENTLDPKPKLLLVTAFGKDLREKDRQLLDGVLFKPFTISDLMDSTLEALCIPQETHSQKDFSIENTLPRLDGVHILLAEDNELNRQLARELLTGAGARVTTAVNGREAMHKVLEYHFDMVLMDVQMPELDGYEATRQIRNTAGQEKLPIIAMTANAMVGDREAAILAGMNDHVPKPVNPAQLFATIIRWLPRHFQETTRASFPASGPPERQENLTLLPGIDTASGITRAGDNLELYMELLSRFREEYADISDSIRRNLEEGDLQQAQMTVHTLKGVSGNLGMDSVFTHAGSLDMLLRRPTEKETLLKTWLDFDAAMSATLEGLKGLTEPMPKEIHLLTGTSEELLDCLRRLQPEVANLKPKRCAPIMAELEKHNWPSPYAADVNRILRQVRTYQLKDALIQVQKLIRMLEDETHA